MRSSQRDLFDLLFVYNVLSFGERIIKEAESTRINEIEEIVV